MDVRDYDKSEGDNCRAILYYLEEIDSLERIAKDQVPELRSILLGDLCWRASRAEAFERAVILANAFHAMMPGELRTLFSKEALGLEDLRALPKQEKEYKDVAIITMIEPEINAILRALGKLPNEPANEKSGNYSYWFAELTRPSNRPLHVVITVVGQSGNVPCALAVDRLHSDFNIGLIMLIGIAAGVQGRVKLGDAVCGNRVYDYEYQRLEKVAFMPFLRIAKRRPRPRDWNVDKDISVAMQQFETNRMQLFWTELMQNVNSNEIPVEWRSGYPSIHTGTIAAGNKLIADDSLTRMYFSVDQTIRAADMEGSGFAQACIANNTKWCIFRGISDYGDSKKNNNWQIAAALSASASGITFLRTWART